MKPRRRFRKNKDNHIQIGKVNQNTLGRVQEPWWGACPVCPINKGFVKRRTHGSAISWAMLHVEEHRKAEFIEALKASRHGR